MGYLTGAPHPLPLAHRGGAALPTNAGAENTLAAFRRAHALGIRYLETDVHVSSDGVVYAFHDLDLSRLTGTGDAIADTSSEQVDLVRLPSGEPIPRLADLLVALPDCHWNIDVKSDGAVEPTLRVLAEAGASDRACLASFSTSRLHRIRRLTGAVATATTPLEIAALALPVPLAWRLVGRGGAVATQVPVRRGPFTIVSARFVRRAHHVGQAVHVWTIDDPAEIDRLLDLGVDGIVSDRPDVLLDVLARRAESSVR